jgi:PAS domain S-box-containing protein
MAWLTSRKRETKNRLAWFKDLPLRYRLIVPFLGLAFFGTFSLVWLFIMSQNDLMEKQENHWLVGIYHSFQHTVDLRGRWAVSLASGFARNPEVAAALAERDRARLIRLCYPAFIFLEQHYGIKQFHFEVVPGRSFLRLHRLYQYGDLLTPYRKQIQDVLEKGVEVYGLECGVTGYGIRGVVPVHWEGRLVGSLEIGFALGEGLLDEVRRRTNVEISLMLPGDEDGVFQVFATSLPEAFDRKDSVYREVFATGKPRIFVRELFSEPYAVLVGPIRNYAGETEALVELLVNRSEVLALAKRYRHWMLGIGVLGMILSVGAIYVVSLMFTRPIARMIEMAREIASGKPVRPTALRPSGELGVLADALDEMVSSLEVSRRKISEYADNLEDMVRERTQALRESEEKYRTLVETVPLVVYRLDREGRTIYINRFVEELLGLSPETVLREPDFWKMKVCEEDRERLWPLMERCLREGTEFKAEYRVCHASGRFVYVLDHALPVLHEDGSVRVVDGFLVDVTDRHRLQQQIIQTEELRTLSEISARLAHEIRNPLAVAGGFARRLLLKLPEDDPNRRKVSIILEEVMRLEGILERILAYLKPVEVSLERMALNDAVTEVIRDNAQYLFQAGVNYQLELAEGLCSVMLDRALFKQALETLLRSVVGFVRPEGGQLLVRTGCSDNNAQLELIARGVQVSEDDLDHFFYPFTSRVDETRTLDLPLAKMIVYKHGGLIRVYRKGSEELHLSLNVPLS